MLSDQFPMYVRIWRTKWIVCSRGACKLAVAAYRQRYCNSFDSLFAFPNRNERDQRRRSYFESRLRFVTLKIIFLLHWLWPSRGVASFVEQIECCALDSVLRHRGRCLVGVFLDECDEMIFFSDCKFAHAVSLSSSRRTILQYID